MSDSLFVRRILIVDDQPAIHGDYRNVFSMAEPEELPFLRSRGATGKPAAARRWDFELDSAFQGEEALAKVLEANALGLPYTMAFIDMRMPPGWDGVETTQRLWEVCPDLQVVICTAHSDYSWTEMIERFGRTDRLVLLKKPFDPLEILQLAHSLTEKARLLQSSRRHTAELEVRVVERTRELEAANAALKAEMAERAAAEEAMRQAQKMEALGQLAAGVAHDFNNLLSVIRGYSGILLNEDDLASGVRHAVQEMDLAAERATQLTRQLLAFSRKEILEREPLLLPQVVNGLGSLLRRLLGETITLQIEDAGMIPPILADQGMVEQMVLNLAVNARDAMPQGGPLLIRSSRVELTAEDVRHPAARAGGFACLSVTDRGCGIAPDVMPRLFEPFFTTKAAGKGTGLGLATVQGIAQQHEGWVEVESAPGIGSTFKIFLPEISLTFEPARAPEAPAKAAGGRETILLVEDEPALRDAAQIVLEQHGYRVYLADSGAKALEAWPTFAEEVDLLLTDVVMPGGISGQELARRLQASKPGLRVVFGSGYSVGTVELETPLEEGRNFLPKPYTFATLAAIVRDCLDGCAPAPLAV